MVVVDNASDAFAGNENDRAEVRMFVRGMLGNMASINNQAVLLLAHIDKAAARGYAAGNNYSGSTAWHNSSRSRLALLSVDGGVSLSHEKSNLAAKLDAPLALAWTDEGLLQPSGLDCEAERKRSEKQLREDADLLESLIVIAIASGDLVTAAKGGAHTTASRRLTELPKHFKRRAKPDSPVSYIAQAGWEDRGVAKQIQTVIRKNISSFARNLSIREIDVR